MNALGDPTHADRESYLEDELLALSTQLEEARTAIDQHPNAQVAFQSFQDELEDHQTFLNDQRFAESISAAVHQDGNLITSISSQDVQNHQDRQFVLQSSNDDPEIESPPPNAPTEVDDDFEKQISAIAETLAGSSFVEEAGHPTSHAQQAHLLQRFSSLFTCIVCISDVPAGNMILVKECNHRYCNICVKELFMRSTKDETLFPPRCCRHEIPLSQVENLMTPEELSRFEEASIEFTTRNRTYCSNLNCNRFINPSRIEHGTNRAVCSHCYTETCSLCKNGYHHNEECPQDPAVQEMRQLARDRGWQECGSCGATVDLRSGCNHITCRCTFEFCYVCGVEWKNCQCPHADIVRIEERAGEIVERDAGPDLHPDILLQRVNELVPLLQQNHECQHSRRFERIAYGAGRRGFQCEICFHRHWKYILQCRRCRLRACEECRRNRI